MTFKKYLPIAFVIAVIAAALQCVDQLLSQNMLTKYAGFGWISFQAWAVYFLGGCTVKGGVKAFFSYLLGIIASIAIFKLGGLLGHARLSRHSRHCGHAA